MKIIGDTVELHMIQFNFAYIQIMHVKVLEHPYATDYLKPKRMYNCFECDEDFLRTITFFIKSNNFMIFFA